MLIKVQFKLTQLYTYIYQGRKQYFIKLLRLKWAEHVTRMQDHKNPKKMSRGEKQLVGCNRCSGSKLGGEMHDEEMNEGKK